MFGTITVTGQTPASPALQLADVAAGPWVADGAALVAAADWDTKKELTIELAEMSFTPKDATLTVGQPYVITVVNKGTEKHEFTAEDFFKTIAFRKAEDASGEFKAPAPREVEVFAGTSIELFLIPTKVGTYQLVCEIGLGTPDGHFEQGMFGTFTSCPDRERSASRSHIASARHPGRWPGCLRVRGATAPGRLQHRGKTLVATRYSQRGRSFVRCPHDQRCGQWGPWMTTRRRCPLR